MIGNLKVMRPEGVIVFGKKFNMGEIIDSSTANTLLQKWIDVGILETVEHVKTETNNKAITKSKGVK